MDYSTVRTDVLVVGAGAAGIRAAIEAQKANVDTVLLTKGRLGKTGSTFYPWVHGWGYQACLESSKRNHCLRLHLEDILKAGQGMCDESLAEILVKESAERFYDLVDYGLRFGKEKRQYVQDYGCFSSEARCLTAGMKNIKESLTGMVRRGNISLHEEMMAVDLVVEHGECVGAIAINLQGDATIFLAKSTILATGGGGNLFLLNLNTEDLTGDGQAMALRAGAELTNLEFFQIAFGVLNPTKKVLFEGRLFDYDPKMRNSLESEFVSDYLPRETTLQEAMHLRSLHAPFSTRDVSKYIDIAAYTEILEGRGSKEGGVFLDLRHVEEGKIRSTPLGDLWWRWVSAKNFNLQKECIQVAPHCHAFNGGLRIGEKGETSIPGLYAAGEVAAGPHGADRLGGNMIPATQVFGARAGKHGAKRAKRMTRIPTSGEQRNLVELTESFVKKGEGNHSVSSIKMQLRRLMWERVLVKRDEAGLHDCILSLERIEKKIFEANTAPPEKDFAALELRNMIELAKAIAVAARARKESRGAHHRTDFPERDNSRFNANLIVFLRNGNVVCEIT